MKKNTEKRPSILFVSPNSQVKLTGSVIYGFERRVSYLGRILSKGYNTIILEPDDGFAYKKELEQKLTFNSFSFIKVKNLRLGSLFLDLNPFYILKLVKILKKYNPSVVIISFPFGISISYLVIKKFLKLNTILIYNSHNVESEYSKIIAKDENLPWIARLFYSKYISIIEKFATTCSDYIIAVSEENKNCFCQKYTCDKEKIIVINIGAHIPKVTSKSNIKPTKQKDEILAVFHGTYNATHNRNAINLIYTYLAEKLKRLKNLKFVVTGNGVPIVKKENYISLGFVENLHNFLSSCDIAIVPLEEGEGTKLKIFDYMTAGLPIITTKKGAEGMGLIDGKNAIITDHVDENFVTAIETLVKNPKMRKELAQNVKKLIEKEYHPKIIKEKIYKFLDKIISESEYS